MTTNEHDAQSADNMHSVSRLGRDGDAVAPPVSSISTRADLGQESFGIAAGAAVSTVGGDQSARPVRVVAADFARTAVEKGEVCAVSADRGRRVGSRGQSEHRARDASFDTVV